MYITINDVIGEKTIDLPLRKLGIPDVHIKLYLRYTLFAIECTPEEYILCTSTVPYVVINNTD